MDSVLMLLSAALIGMPFHLVHDPYHLSDWIQDGKFQDPQTSEFCCGPSDCKPLPADAVTEAPNGNFFIRPTRELFPGTRVIWRSRDGDWWQCLKHYDGIPQTRCLIGPPRGV